VTAPLPMRLGWQPGPPDPRTLRLDSYTTPDLPAPPATSDWSKKVTQWPVLGNDHISDCVFVSCAHLVQAWTGYATGAEALIPQQDVVGAYSRVTGYDPETGRGDNGTVSLDALNFWRKTGIGGHKIAAYVKVDHRNDDAVRSAMHLFGGLYIAAQLPLAARTQFQRNKIWTPTGGSAGRRGSWGGHAVRMGSYGRTGFTVSTWGRVQKANWTWWDTYVVESFAVVSADWLNRTGGANPLGFDLDSMLADLRRITT
jgi:hypothetical protein